MSIQLVTYANQTVTPTNDAIIYERAIDQNGIFYGCNVTVSGNEVHITGGYGIVCGREFTVQSESIAVTLAPSGTLEGRLYVRLDLADADAPIQLLTATGNTLPPLEQDSDVNYTNGTYEMELATFDVGVSSLSNVSMTYETIVGTKAAILENMIVAEQFSNTSSISITAGAVGTYANRAEINCAKAGYTLIGAFIKGVSSPGSYHASVTATLNNTTIYVSLYRATGSAVTVAVGEIVIIALYEKS